MNWKNKEEAKQYLRQWQEKNKEVLKEKAKIRYLKNAEKIKRKARKYHRNHREKYREYSKNYYKQHKDKDEYKRKADEYRKLHADKIKEQGILYRKRVGRKVLSKRWNRWKRHAVLEGRYHPSKAKRKYKRTKGGAFCSYRKSAKKRNIVFELDKNDFFSLLEKQCVYCGADNAHGVDRLDNTIGYTKNNSVSCCWFCNRAKGPIPLNEWRQWIKRIITYNSDYLK